jgi:hypothetical protein
MELDIVELAADLIPVGARWGRIQLPAKLRLLVLPINARVRHRCLHSRPRSRILGMSRVDRRRDNQSSGEKNNSHDEASLFSSANG